MWFPLRNQIMTEREPKEIIQALINEYKTYKKASFLIIPILAIAAAATFFNRVLSLVLLAAAVIYQIFYLRKKQKKLSCVRHAGKPASYDGKETAF